MQFQAIKPFECVIDHKRQLSLFLRDLSGFLAGFFCPILDLSFPSQQ